MRNSLTITFEGDHILVRSDGEKDMEFATKVWSQVAATCEESNCFNVLGIAKTQIPVEALDGYDHARLFRDLDIDGRYRIAWVETSADAVDVAQFIELVLTNRGLHLRVFETEEEARPWLFGGKHT